MTNEIYDHDEESENVGLVFGHGFFARSAVAAEEDTNEIMSYMMPEFNVLVQAFLVDDFDGDDATGVEIMPNASKGTALIRIDRRMWEFVEGVADDENEALLFQGMVLGELLVGTAHRIVAFQTGKFPVFV